MFHSSFHVSRFKLNDSVLSSRAIRPWTACATAFIWEYRNCSGVHSSSVHHGKQYIFYSGVHVASHQETLPVFCIIQTRQTLTQYQFEARSGIFVYNWDNVPTDRITFGCCIISQAFKVNKPASVPRHEQSVSLADQTRPLPHQV
jgi:hypothetical protein